MQSLVIKNNEINDEFEFKALDNDEIREIALIKNVYNKPEKFDIKRRKNMVLIQFYKAYNEPLQNIIKVFMDNYVPLQIHFCTVEPSIKFDLEDLDLEDLINLRLIMDNELY